MFRQLLILRWQMNDFSASQLHDAATGRNTPLAIIQLGDPPADLTATHGTQSDWMRRVIGSEIPVVVIRPHLGEPLPLPTLLAGAVLTGSWSMVTDHETWSERTAEWVRSALACQLPLLGICYGHQLIAHALGGEVDFHPEGREIGQHEIRLTKAARGDSLFADFPPAFAANLTHEQTVLAPPPGAVVLASSEHDAHQILRYGPEAFSVQFHPEFDANLMSACLVRREPVFTREGYDIAAMVRALQETSYARSVLTRFTGNLSGAIGAAIQTTT